MSIWDMIDQATSPNGLKLDVNAGDTLSGRCCSGNSLSPPALSSKHPYDTYLMLSTMIDFKYLSSYNHVNSSFNAYNPNSNIKYNTSLLVIPKQDPNNKLGFTRNTYKDIRVNFLKLSQ